jgi:small subunit ribosomal protein S13
MAFIFLYNKNISPNKRIKNALTSIFGIGEKRALEIAHYLCINPNLRLGRTSPTQISRITGILKEKAKEELVGNSLQKKINQDILIMNKIRCYKGLRHKNKLPVRGQRTHTNAQTQKKMTRT